MRVSDASGTTTSSAKAPASVEPNTRSPTAKPAAPDDTPGPTDSTVPANSLPGTNGVGTSIWYSLATSSTSGKLTAAAPTRTRTWPSPTSGSGWSSTTVTTSGGPYARHTAARTAGHRPVHTGVRF